jgi:hypothetical protein
VIAERAWEFWHLNNNTTRNTDAMKKWGEIRNKKCKKSANIVTFE